MSADILMGQLPRQWNDGAKSITFCVTEDCNLACKYCYMTGKNTKHKMTFDVAKKAVDYILGDRQNFREEAVVWEFIGGEPFLEINLVDQISDYIKQQMFLLKHPWFDAYRFNFSTNGINYHTHAVQKYIWKNKGHVSIGISIDGNKRKHDLQRVKKDGTGSFDQVMKNVPLWMRQMPNSATKATFSHDDLPHLKESVIFLWGLGIKYVAANVVFEDVWADGDDIIFEDQLRALADYVIDNELYYDYSVRFFDPQVGNPLTEDNLDSNYCGAGNMLAIDCDGNFYPCIRFYDISLSNKRGRKIGDVDSGINPDKLRPFHVLTLRSQSSEECMTCEVGRGCSWCNGCNYDVASTDTIFERATFICKMHKANARANDYFWKLFSERTGLPSEKEKLRAQSMRQTQGRMQFAYIMESDECTPHCNYRNWSGGKAQMTETLQKKSKMFCEKNGYVPIYLGDAGTRRRAGESYSIIDAAKSQPGTGAVIVYDNTSEGGQGNNDVCILLVNRTKISSLSKLILDLADKNSRINLILEELVQWTEQDLVLYAEQLDIVANFITERYMRSYPLELNVLTDLWDLTQMCDCGAGETSVSIAPNGKIYLCPAFYYADPESCIGSLDDGVQVEGAALLSLERSPYCANCDIHNCRRCKFLNKEMTGEINIPSRIQCRVSYVERNISAQLQQQLMDMQLISPENIIRPVKFNDSLELIVSQSRARR